MNTKLEIVFFVLDGIIVFFLLLGVIWMVVTEKRLKRFFLGKKAKDLEETIASLETEIDTLKQARNNIEKQDELTKKCVSAMVYPCVIGGFCIMFVIGLVRGVLPQIVPMLEGMHTKLPLISRLMIVSSNIVSRYGFQILIISELP